MPKFARPNSYNGKQSNQSWTGQTRAATATEASAGEAEQLYISPATLASAVDDLLPDATTTSKGKVELATLAELQTGTAPAGAWVPTANDVATVIAGVVVGAVPPAQEGQAGIAFLATQSDTNTGTNDAKIVTPLKLKTVIGNASYPAAFTNLAATGVGTGNILTSDTASSLTTTGAGIDLTIDSAAGRLVLTGGEAVADAVRIEADDAGGGIDIDAGTLGIIADTTGAISLDSQAASNFTVTGAGLDLSLGSVLGSVLVSSTENAALAIRLHVNGGTSETIQVHSDQGTGVASVGLLSDVGGLTLRSTGLASADAINLEAAAGGVDIDAALEINVTSTQSAATAISLIANTVGGGITMTAAAGGILPTTSGKITAISTSNSAQAIELHANGGTSETVRIRSDQGTGVASLDLLSDVGGITLASGLNSGNAINLEANTAGGGIDIDSSTGGFDVLTTGAISLDASLASNLTVTGAAVDLTLSSSGGSVVITGTEAAVDAIQLNATTALGGIDVNAGTGGITVDSGGLMSLDAAGIVNLTTTGAFDITVNSTAGSIVITGAEAAVDAVQINATTAGGGIDMNADSGGVTIDTTAAISLDSATASNFTVTGAADLTLQSTAGAVNVISGEANADSINVTSAGGMSIVAVGAAAKDILITNTNGSMTLSAGESATDAMNFTAGGAASGINFTAGTNGILLSSGQKVKVTAVVTGVDASPYALLGTDYFLSVDTGAGVMTITLPASPATGRKVTIYDAGGAAAGSNITIDGNGKNIAAAGTAAATKLINTAYESYNLVYNGTLWLGQNIV